MELWIVTSFSGLSSIPVLIYLDVQVVPDLAIWVQLAHVSL